MPTLLLFGASGAIGRAVARRFMKENVHVVWVSRTGGAESCVECVKWSGDHLEIGNLIDQLKKYENFDAICWAQGINHNDNIYSVTIDEHRNTYCANVEYIIFSLKALLNNHLVADGARLCIISSVWQKVSRENKFSYGITKSAIHGLVLSLSADLGVSGILVNAVLPGAIDTPMTRENLTEAQIQKISKQTGHDRLVSLEDVANAVWMLNSDLNTGITGNFVTVDLGFSHVKEI